MKRILLTIVLVICAVSAQADRLRGIRINSFGGPVIVFFGANQVCPPSTTCFVANLKSGFYTVEVYESRFRIDNQPEWRGRLLYRERIYFNGLGIVDVEIPQSYDNGDYDRRREHDHRRHIRDGYFYRPMSSEVFDDLVRSLKREVGDSNKTDVLRTVCGMNYFTVGQCRQIMELYSFDEGKMSAFKMMYPRILDKSEVFTLASCFSFLSNKEEMMRFVSENRGHDIDETFGRYVYAMSPEAFRRFMREYEEEAFSSGKEKMLDLCISSNWFTVKQCREIVQSFSFDSEKVKIMKKIFPKVVDKGSFFTLLDCLSFSNSKREVERFISNCRVD